MDRKTVFLAFVGGLIAALMIVFIFILVSLDDGS